MLGINFAALAPQKATAIEAVCLLHEQLLSNSWLNLARCSLFASMHVVCSLSNR